MTEPFVPPPYPYDRLDEVAAVAERHEGGMVDLSVGTPCDPPPESVVARARVSGTERGYPPSIGSPALRAAASKWIARRFGVDEPAALAACIGTKEFVGTLPQWLHLRRPDRDTVLYPAVSYPTYEMGAILAGCRAVPVPRRRRLAARPRRDRRSRRSARAVPVGQLAEQPDGRARRSRRRGSVGPSPRRSGVQRRVLRRVHVGRPAAIDPRARHRGLVAVHSLSKRSNLAGVRVGFYAGDPDLVSYLLRGAQARRDDGARARAGGWRRGARRHRARRGAARSIPRSSRTPGEGALRLVGRVGVAAAGRLLPLGAGARRRRMGVHTRDRRSRGRRS